MKQIQQQVKEKLWDNITILIVIGSIVLVSVCVFVIRQTTLEEGWVDYKEWKQEDEDKKDKYKEVNRAISKRRRERNLARQHAKDLKKIFDYVDR